MLEELLRRLNLDLTGLANALRGVIASPIGRGAVVSVVIDAGSTSASALHGLGRAHQGGAVVSASGSGAAVSVAPASDSTTVTVSLSAALGSDITVRVWVF